MIARILRNHDDADPSASNSTTPNSTRINRLLMAPAVDDSGQNETFSATFFYLQRKTLIFLCSGARKSTFSTAT